MSATFATTSAHHRVGATAVTASRSVSADDPVEGSTR